MIGYRRRRRRRRAGRRVWRPPSPLSTYVSLCVCQRKATGPGARPASLHGEVSRAVHAGRTERQASYLEVAAASAIPQLRGSAVQRDVRRLTRVKNDGRSRHAQCHYQGGKSTSDSQRCGRTAMSLCITSLTRRGLAGLLRTHQHKQVGQRPVRTECRNAHKAIVATSSPSSGDRSTRGNERAMTLCRRRRCLAAAATAARAGARDPASPGASMRGGCCRRASLSASHSASYSARKTMRWRAAKIAEVTAAASARMCEC
jgi:hypothetical protein